MIGFREALAIAGAPPDEPDLAPAHERAIGQWAAQEHGSNFVAVEGYPMSKRPFYTHPQPGDERWSNSFDLLFRGQELVTGGQRLHRLLATTWRPSGPAARTPRPTRATWRPSRTGCRRTAGSRSAWSGGPAG